MKEVGLNNAQERLSNFPHQFSGGQLQRICIALSLAQNCELLIADEPTTALDVTIQKQIVSLLRELKEKRNLTVIFISHDIDLVAEISDRILVMQNGLIVEQGISGQIVEEPHEEYTKRLIAASPVFGQHYDDESIKADELSTFAAAQNSPAVARVQNLQKRFNMEGGFFACSIFLFYQFVPGAFLISFLRTVSFRKTTSFTAATIKKTEPSTLFTAIKVGSYRDTFTLSRR